MIRITTGSAKNKKLQAPNIEGYRAVQEVAKMAVFSIIGDQITNKKCLDLFAGSGNMGIEALSRGAGFCTFVDENPEAIATIEKNLFTCNFFENFEIIRKDALKYVLNTENTYDIIFLDPFYAEQSHRHLLKNLGRICAKNGYIFFFHVDDYNLVNDLGDTGLELVNQRKFGKSVFSQLTKSL